MLITNGTKTRNIDASRLPEYVAKGYTEVKAVANTATTETPATPKASQKSKK